MRRTSIVFLFCCAPIVTACSSPMPVAPSVVPSTTGAVPAPVPPTSPFATPFTELPVNGAIHRNVREKAENPDCVDFPGWGCHYFRIRPASDGFIEIRLTWLLETQPFQPLDLSLSDAKGSTVWSTYLPGPLGVLQVPVAAGSTYQVTVWYTFVGVDFELRSSFEAK